MNTIIAFIFFAIGTALGSFLSVIIYRLQTKTKGMFLGHSFCPACKSKITWRYLVPIVSWVFLRGKCAYCGKKISVHYPALELTGGLLFLSLFLHFDLQITAILIYHLIILSFLLAIFFYDLLHQEIPDQLSIPAIIIAIIGNLIFGSPSIIAMLIGGGGILCFFLLQFLISKGNWIGGGDLRLGLFIGIYLGWEMGLLAVIIAYLIGAIFSIYLLATGKVQRKSAIAFGPFLVMGTIISLFYGDQLLNLYLNTFLI